MTIQAEVVFSEEQQLKGLMLSGMFMAIIGETGCGKTVTTTWLLWKLNEVIRNIPDIKIFTNYNLIDIPHYNLFWDWQRMTHPDELLDLPKWSIIGIDDMWRWCLDSYKTTSRVMEKYDEIQACGRKRGYLIIASTQRFGRLDTNFRNNVHYIIQPEVLYDDYDLPVKIVFMVIDNHTRLPEGLPTDFNCNPVFEMYNTSEEITPFNQQERFDIEDLAKRFIEWNTIPTENQIGEIVKLHRKVTMSGVNLFLMKNGLDTYMSKDEKMMLKEQVMRL